MKTNDKRRRAATETMNARDVFTTSEEQSGYLKANEKSGKKAAQPTAAGNLPDSVVERRKLFPAPEADKGKKHPTMGV